VRVPRGEYHFLARALDCGAHGVMVPMVNNGAEARAIAEATHYPPRGRRGAAFGFTHDDYAMSDVNAKMKALDQRNVVIAQIETEHGLENVEEIAASEGIDMLWVGHFDLTNFLGIPGRFEHPTFLEALDRIVAAGRKHKKGLGFLVVDPASAKLYRGKGFNVLGAGTDHGLILAGLEGILGAL
jgi:2-dehydro-3-deoxyglucarate aldolase/4-hydroxy-2-oxoheptanedioate aldolase